VDSTDPGLQAHISVGCVIEFGAIIGVPYDGWGQAAHLSTCCHVRTGTIIYADVTVGSSTVTGVRALIRERTVIGKGCVIGTDCVIEGNVTLGDYVVLQTGVYIPTHVVIGDRVFIGPRAVLTNDKYPLRLRAAYAPDGPRIEDDVSIGANATLLPGVVVGQGAMVAAGAVVTHHVPAWSLAIGHPAEIRDLPAKLQQPNVGRRGL
jgi:acetyltransferase-like isoleucine patch superfamily enzyme